MPDIRIISAGAGSGKTYQLAELLKQQIVAEGVRPDAILATTFTRKAAAELRERVRGRLLAGGHVDEAEQLGAALIGTVNSVCGALVSEHAFSLNLSPAVRVLEERDADIVMREALADVADETERERLSGLRRRMEQFEWDDILASVVNLARANGIGAEGLRLSRARSLRETAEVLGAADTADLDAMLLAAIEGALRDLSSVADSTKKTAEVRHDLERARGVLRRKGQLSWGDWLKLGKLDPGKASVPAVAGVLAVASRVGGHPGLHADLAEAIGLVFELAERALVVYADRKRALGVIDFTDQETYLLELLDSPDARVALSERFELVLVDEFQDTSPLQLNIFVKLSELVSKNVWVGDQKQAIYGFRGADPALMDAAVNAISEREPPLSRSFRSRPPLVRLTSDLFVPPFAAWGLEEAFVRLEPARDDDDAVLGPVAEVWRLERKKGSRGAGGEVESLAAAVQAFLADGESRVRDRESGETRGARPGDLAILCSRNDVCDRVADALRKVGLSVVIASTGLMTRPEVRLVHAGLRLWIDPGDALAMAEVARLLRYPDDLDGFMSFALQGGGTAPFHLLEAVAPLLEAREAWPECGLVEAVDHVIDVLRVRDHAVAWGDAPQRVANVDAFRAHCVRYAESAAAQQRAATPAGLLVELARLSKAKDDAQAVVTTHDEGGEGAVTVSTWHGAKGLEWPVTVLFDLEHERRPDVCGVRIATDGAFDFHAPLRGRWIRLWLDPYRKRQTGSALHAGFEAHDGMAAAVRAYEHEMLRLLYVGWTRARDRVVLAGRAGWLDAGRLAPIADLLEEPLAAAGVAQVTWAGRPVQIRVRDAAPFDIEAPPPQAGLALVGAGRRAHAPLYVQPSSLHAEAASGAPDRLGEPPRLSGAADMARVGEGVHAYLAADRPEMTPDDRFALASTVISSWGLSPVLAPRSLVRAGDSLRAWVEGRWPGAVWRREWPVFMRLDGGQMMRGACDLVLETDDGLVVIDHKSFPGSEAEAVARAATHGGQLAAYGRALAAATGRPLAATWIHLPLAGVAVPVFERDPVAAV